MNEPKTTPAPEISTETETIKMLREQLKDYKHRCFQAVDTLHELSYVIDGMELLDRFADSNCLSMPDDAKDLNACAALKEAGMESIKSYMAKLEALITNEPVCVEI